MKTYRKLWVAVVAIGVATFSQAQVGIGISNPHSRSILDLTNSNNKGLMLPSLTSTPAAGADTSGLLFYYNDALYFRDTVGYNVVNPWKYRYNGSTTEAVYFNPSGYVGVGIGVTDANVKGNFHVANNSKEVAVLGTSAAIFIGDDDAGTHMIMDNDEILVKSGATTAGILKLQEGGGTVQVGESISVTSTFNVYGKVQENGVDLVPSGVIMMWSGSTATIPAGWALCDGNYYDPTDVTVGQSGQASSDATHTKLTPDLRDRFIVGAGSSYAVGATGGSTSSAHTHSVDPPNTSTTTNGAHTHTGTTGGPSGTITRCWCSSGSVGDGNHTHDFTTDSDGAHSHTVNISSFTSGSASNTENRPPYMALAYIMKL